MSFEAVYRSYQAAQEHKRKRGGPRQPFDRDLIFIKKWEYKTVDASQLANLQYYVSSFAHDGTYRIFLELESTKIQAISDNFSHLKRSCDPRIKEWLSTINDDLKFHIRSRKRPPLILIDKPMFTWGHVYDGNHTAIAMQLLEREGHKPTIPVFKGYIRPVHRMIRDFITFHFEGTIPHSDRLRIMKSRVDTHSK